MNQINDQRERVRNARAEVRSDMRRITDTVQNRLDDVQNTVHNAREKLDLSKRFSNNFWQTAGMFVGAGVAAAMLFGGRKNLLTSRQVKQLSRGLASKVVPSAAGLLAPTTRPLLSTTLLTSLANIAISMYQAKKTRSEVRAPNYRSQNDHAPLH